MAKATAGTPESAPTREVASAGCEVWVRALGRGRLLAVRGLGETLADLARALRETPLEARGERRLKEIARLLHRLPPGQERDRLLAEAYLRLYQITGHEEFFLRGYSYARTGRSLAVRLKAEKLGESP